MTTTAPKPDISAFTQEEYGADSLQTLKGLDAVRKRPGMYIGSTDGRGLSHALVEISDNSVDESLAGFCKRIKITLHTDGSAEVEDDGRGIPTGINKAEGMSGVELVFTELHAGGKFGGGSYAASGGLHGVGASVVNALSTRLDVDVKREGKIHSVSFSRGVPGKFDKDQNFTPQKGLTVTGKVAPADTGTKVRFWPDHEIFLAGSTINYDDVCARMRQSAFLVPGLEITVTDERPDEPLSETFKFDGGIKDFVEFLAPDRPVSDDVVIVGEGTFKETVPVFEDGKMVSREVERHMGVEVAMRWGTGYETNIKSFVNIVTTSKGGTHVTGFERALNKAVNDSLRNLKILKANEESVTKEDVQEGLTAVVLVRIPEPQFESQTKDTLGTPAATAIVQQIVTNHLKEFFSNPKNKAQAKNILDKVNQAAKTRKAARLHKETIRRKNALETSAMPNKLADCRSDDMERAELFIIEGDSAGGTVKAARDSEFQALMPIRGKILNTMRATEKQMLDNVECAAIITAMGAGSGRSFDIAGLRYGKLIVLADADVDGAHIRCLLLTLCWRYMRPLLEAGRVYAAMPPLHRITEKTSGTYHYTYTQEEYLAKMAELESAGKGVRDVQRYKGLGEMDADQLAETTIDINKRKLRRMTMEDAEEAATAFEMLMGQDVAGRKSFIVEYGGLLDPERIDV